MTNSKLVQTSVEFRRHNDYSLQLNRWILKSIGAWPQINASCIIWKIFVLLQICICSIIVIVITVPCLLYILLEENDINLKLGAIGGVIHRSMGWLNYWILLKRSNDIRDCIRHMETDWTLIKRIEDREVMLQYAKFGRFVTIICGVIMEGGTFLFSVAKLMKTTTITVDNETFTMHPMTCPIYSKFVDVRFSPVNEIALVIQFLSSIIVNLSTIGACSLAAAFAMHACGQLNVLYMWLDELDKTEEKKINAVKRKLTIIVEHHLRVLSFISRIESIMHKISLVQLMGCTMCMCLLGYYFIVTMQTFDAAKITSYIILYVSMAFNIFIFCYIGEIITEQCKHVGEMAYRTNWYKLHHKTALDLILIILRSNNVIKITAGKLFQLSISTFGDVIKTSMAYLNVLRAMTM